MNDRIRIYTDTYIASKLHWIYRQEFNHFCFLPKLGGTVFAIHDIRKAEKKRQFHCSHLKKSKIEIFI